MSPKMTIEDLAAEVRARLDEIANPSGAQPKAAEGAQPRKLKFGGQPLGSDDEYANPLAVPRAAFAEMDEALQDGRTHRYVVKNAALTTTTYGQPTEWDANAPGRIRMLQRVARVPMSNIGAVAVEHPKFTLPTAAAGVAEGVTLGEYDRSTAGTVALKRFGRFTDVTTESAVGTNARTLSGLHQLAIAKDLDQVLVDAVETDAGTAVAFQSDVPAAIRKRMASVMDATAADATELTILVHPDDTHLLEAITPASGSDVAEGFTRFSGAIVYPTSYVTSGIAVVANLAFGCRYFQAQGVRLETDFAVKTGVLTYATSVIGGFGTGLVSGYAEAQDVVTP